MDQRLLKVDAERRNKGRFMQIEVELSRNNDSISEILCFFRNLQNMRSASVGSVD